MALDTSKRRECYADVARLPAPLAVLFRQLDGVSEWLDGAAAVEVTEAVVHVSAAGAGDSRKRGGGGVGGGGEAGGEEPAAAAPAKRARVGGAAAAATYVATGGGGDAAAAAVDGPPRSLEELFTPHSAAVRLRVRGTGAPASAASAGRGGEDGAVRVLFQYYPLLQAVTAEAEGAPEGTLVSLFPGDTGEVAPRASAELHGGTRAPQAACLGV